MSSRAAPLFVVGLIAGLGLALASARVWRPALREGVPLSQAYQDRDGKLLRLTLSQDQKYRLWLPLAEISPTLIDATLLLEDRHFRLHPGVNPISIVRAFGETYLSRGRRIGGSTLTMQLARLRYGINSGSIAGKLEQSWRALMLELRYSKNEILEAYLNLVPYGGNIEGVGAASVIYFGKAARDLAFPEAFGLSVIPQNPTKKPRNEALWAKARLALYGQWRAAQPAAIQGAHDAEMQLPFFASARATRALPFLAPHWVDRVARAQEHDAVTPYVRTTLDSRAQSLLESVVRSYLERVRPQGVRNASGMLIDHATMEVRAYLGSAGYFDARIQGQVNGAAAKRSPGSALKPFLYALAMDQGLIHPESLLKDAPTSFGSFDPENFERDFVGPISARQALIKSRNIPAVHLSSRVNSPSLYGLLRAAGVTQLKDEKHYGLSIALGGAEITMEELGALYAMLPQQGRLRPLRFRPTDPMPDGEPLLSPESAFMTMDILSDHDRPQQFFDREWTRAGSSSAGKVYWKTGTSHGFRDAWTAGIYGNYALVVWLGDFTGASNANLIGRDMAAPLFFQVVDALRAGDRALQFPAIALPTSKTRKVKVCAVSGQLPGAHCKHQKPAWYVPGRSPIQPCSIHREIAVRPATGLRACPFAPGAIRKEVYEVWPSDLLAIFRRAGIPRNVPPAYEPACRIEGKGAIGSAPSIISPKEDLTYLVRMDDVGKQTIPLTASTDGDVREVFWFADDRYIGRSRSSAPLFWPATVGRVVIRAVDDQGRSQERTVEVLVAK